MGREHEQQSCPDAGQVARLLDRELGAGAEAGLLEHINACGTCGRRYGLLLEVEAALACAPATKHAGTRRRLTKAAAGIAAAALVLGAVLVVWSPWSGGGRSGPPPAAPDTSVSELVHELVVTTRRVRSGRTTVESQRFNGGPTHKVHTTGSSLPGGGFVKIIVRGEHP